MKKNITRNGERGIALFFSIFALLLLTAIAGTLAFMASLETSVNSNYRQEQMAYFGAKAGIEDARARMMQTDPNSITQATPLPITIPSTSNASVVYIVNPAGTADPVQPWSSTNKYADDELCHDGYAGYASSLFTIQQVIAPGVHCTTSSTSSTAVLPSGAQWYASYNSELPYNGTSSALPYKWARISPKLNSSDSYLNASGSIETVSNYSVNSSVPYTASTPICWTGTAETPLVPIAANCSLMYNAAGSPMTTVYLITSLGVSPTGARKMMQAEVALAPTPPFKYGLYSTSTACPAISFNGNNPATDSYTTANGGTYATTETNTGGDVGANGAVSVGNGNIGGIVGVLAPGSPCATPLSIGSQGTMLGTTACPSGDTSNQPTSCYLQAPYVFLPPPAPTPAPPTTATTPSTCSTTSGSGKNKTKTTYDCLAPGTYGNISIQAPLTSGARDLQHQQPVHDRKCRDHRKSAGSDNVECCRCRRDDGRGYRW